jgi:hypothetical protein
MVSASVFKTFMSYHGRFNVESIVVIYVVRFMYKQYAPEEMARFGCFELGIWRYHGLKVTSLVAELDADMI